MLSRSPLGMLAAFVVTACTGAISGLDEESVDAGERADASLAFPDGDVDATVAIDGGADSSPYAYHQREAWQSPDQPVSGPSMDLLALRYITIHYNGDTRDLSGDYAAVLRAMQNSYLSSRGYSLGYNSGISPDGDEWEIRGLDFRAASNGCQDVNVPAYTIQITLPTPTSHPTDEQIEGARRAIARVRAAAQAAGNSHELILNGHRDVRPLCGSGGTACPGEPITDLLALGALEP
jgi:hypothetical protein